MSKHPSVSTLPIGQAIIRLRLQRGWTQKELAARMGVTQSSLCNCEMERRKAGLKSVRLAARALEIKASELIALAEDMEAEETP